LRFDWYALAAGDDEYRPLAANLTNGPDLAAPLHAIWGTVERHAARLDNLCRRLQRVRFEVGTGDADLVVSIPIADDERIVVVMNREKTEYLLDRGGQWLAANCSEARVDHGIFMLLAELAK
jgi:hypothetical protein